MNRVYVYIVDNLPDCGHAVIGDDHDVDASEQAVLDELVIEIGQLGVHPIQSGVHLMMGKCSWTLILIYFQSFRL